MAYSPNGRQDADLMRRHGKQKAWFSDSTSTARTHIRSAHYPLYQKLCKEKGIPESDHAMPRDLLKAKLEDAAAAKAKAENGGEEKGTLTSMGFAKRTGPKEFSKEGTLEHTAKFVAVTSQVSI